MGIEPTQMKAFVAGQKQVFIQPKSWEIVEPESLNGELWDYDRHLQYQQDSFLPGDSWGRDQMGFLLSLIP